MLSSFVAQCEDSHDVRKHPKEMIAVYLKPESKALLEKALKAKNVKDPKVDYVCINSDADEKAVHVYKPLFGNRTAFRLKGLLTLEDGSTVGIGRLSNMIGELKDPDMEPSLPVFASEDGEAKQQMLLDLPSRIHRLPAAVQSKPFWKGKVPSGKVAGRSYESLPGAQLVNLPSEQQVVVDGYLCSNLCVNSEGKCEFEPVTSRDATVVEEEKHSHEPEIIAHEHEEISKEAAAQSQEDKEDAAECPVCKYIKGGPCKEEFIVWDTCLKALKEEDELHTCFPATKAMMTCMRKYEYYDIMVAGTDYEKIESAAASSQQSAVGDSSPP